MNELLHRMENFQGIMIGATNFTASLDPAVLRRFTENPWVRALLTGLKACVTGVILATALEMLASDCLVSGRPDWIALGLTALLAAVYFGCKPLLKRKLSPIALIVLAAVLGAAVYGI